jgi:hypothetical protein
MKAARIAIALSVLLAACQQDSEFGHLGFELGISDALYEFESGDRILVGTHMCPYVKEWKNDLDEKCYSEHVTGPAVFDANFCWTLEAPGQVVWKFDPTFVEGCDPKFLGDRLAVDVTQPSKYLRLGFDDWRLRAPLMIGQLWGFPHEVVGLTPGQTLDDLREDPGSSRRVIAGQLDLPMLRLDDELGRVYFGRDVEFEVVGQGVLPVPKSLEVEFPGERALVLQPQAVAIVRATFPGDLVLESPPLIAVPATDAASLDLVVMLGAGGIPNYAHARVRDAKGRVLHAAPIDWSVTEGALAVMRGDPDNEARTSEYMVIRGNCEPRSESEWVERHAVLRASFGALEDSVELNWKEPPVQSEGATEKPFVPDPSCMFGGADDEA